MEAVAPDVQAGGLTAEGKLTPMSGNTLGTLFTVTTFGESHGPAIGCVIDGCPPGTDCGHNPLRY